MPSLKMSFRSNPWPVLEKLIPDGRFRASTKFSGAQRVGAVFLSVGIQMSMSLYDFVTLLVYGAAEGREALWVARDCRAAGLQRAGRLWGQLRAKWYCGLMRAAGR
jgi:hypothetical protein